MWGGGRYELIAERFAPVHDRLVRALAPRAGERWLDVATGTGKVALGAARAGADVTGLDVSERLLAEAHARAGREGLAIRFDLGDAQRLPYEDGAFDVVASCFGVVFPPDAAAVARELARVCRRGGRLGLTSWRPIPRIAAIYERFGRGRVGEFEAWGEPERLEALLGESFELELSSGTWFFEGESPEQLWELTATAAPPTKAFLATLDDERREAYRKEMLAYWNGFAGPYGVREPRQYLLVLGRRR